jgi:hypothetical protein
MIKNCKTEIFKYWSLEQVTSTIILSRRLTYKSEYLSMEWSSQGAGKKIQHCAVGNTDFDIF